MIRCRLCKEIYAVLTVEKDGECSEICLVCAKNMQNTYPSFSMLNSTEIDGRFPEIIRIDRMLAHFEEEKSKGNISCAAIKSEIKLRDELLDLKRKYAKNNT